MWHEKFEASLVDDWKTLPPEIRLAVGQKLSSKKSPRQLDSLRDWKNS